MQNNDEAMTTRKLGLKLKKDQAAAGRSATRLLCEVEICAGDVCRGSGRKRWLVVLKKEGPTKG
jgi:hypothetical protein